VSGPKAWKYHFRTLDDLVQVERHHEEPRRMIARAMHPPINVFSVLGAPELATEVVFRWREYELMSVNRAKRHAFYMERWPGSMEDP